MPKISADRLKAGMKLAQPLLRGGIVLLGEGTVLTDAWVQRIQDMNIESVHISGPFEQGAQKKDMLLQLERRFKTVENQPHMDWLKEIVREHIEGLYE